MEETAGFFDWKVGQKANILAIMLGSCCCCLLLWTQQHSFRNELRKAFTDVNDEMHWLGVIFPVIGLYFNHSDLCRLEDKYTGKVSAAKIPWFLAFFLPVLLPFILAEDMDRLNALVEKTAAK